MLSLSSIAGWESAVVASIRGAKGTIEEVDRQIERSGMYGEYPAILRAYQELLADPESAAEALKRAVFIIWCGATEPPVYTAIAALPEGTAHEIMEALDVSVRRGTVDEEMRWMLAWYNAQSPYLFELYGGAPNVTRMLASCDFDAWRRASIAPGQLVARGQMGDYWTTMANGAR